MESRGDKKKGLKQLFFIKDKLDLVLNERALFYGNGIHPKHELTKYHDFFIDNIKMRKNIFRHRLWLWSSCKICGLKKPNE